LTREAEEYIQQENLPAAKALLEEAVALYSEDAERLLENVTAKLQREQLTEEMQREKEEQQRIAARQVEEERRRKQLEKQEAERLAAEEELRRAKETEEARLRETIRNELELARRANEEKRPKRAEPVSLPDLLQKVLPSVVSIEVDDGEGSGFVIGQNLICTNHHVIDGTGSAKISFNNAVTRNAEGTLYKSESMDIAILKVGVPPGIPPLELHQNDPRQGIKVYAIGNPQGSRNSVTDGIVSKVHTTDSFREMTKLDHSGTWVQTNAEINGGNSGRPLINARGVVVGMSTLGSNSQLGLVNINFATSVSNISKALRLAASREVSSFDTTKIRDIRDTKVVANGNIDGLNANAIAVRMDGKNGELKSKSFRGREILASTNRMRFENIDFGNANISGIHRNCRFENCNFQSAEISCEFLDCSFSVCNFQLANINSMFKKKCGFYNCNIKNANFEGSYFYKTHGLLSPDSTNSKFNDEYFNSKRKIANFNNTTWYDFGATYRFKNGRWLPLR